MSAAVDRSPEQGASQLAASATVVFSLNCSNFSLEKETCLIDWWRLAAWIADLLSGAQSACPLTCSTQAAQTAGSLSLSFSRPVAALLLPRDWRSFGVWYGSKDYSHHALRLQSLRQPPAQVSPTLQQQLHSSLQGDTIERFLCFWGCSVQENILPHLLRLQCRLVFICALEGTIHSSSSSSSAK